AGKGGGERRDHQADVAAAWADLTEGERNALLAARAVMNGVRFVVSFDALARYCFDFVEWIRESNEVHRREGGDSDCDAPVCRAAWGEANAAHLRECRDPECEVAICREARRRRISRVPSVREGLEPKPRLGIAEREEQPQCR